MISENSPQRSQHPKVWILLYIVLFAIFTIYTLYLYNQSIAQPEKWQEYSKVWFYWTVGSFFILMWIGCFFNQLGTLGDMIQSYSRGLGHLYADFCVRFGLVIAIVWIIQLCWTMFNSQLPIIFSPLVIVGLLVIYVYIKKESFLVKAISVNFFFPMFLIANLMNLGVFKVI